VRASELEGELFLVREPGSGTREVVRAALEIRAFAPRRTLELGSTEAIKQAVAAGVGVAIVSRAATRDQLAAGTLVILQAPELAIRRTLSRLALVGRVPSAAARAFEEVLGGG
jgi:DNA-binding transcriptional LysR family regulator